MNIFCIWYLYELISKATTVLINITIIVIIIILVIVITQIKFRLLFYSGRYFVLTFFQKEDNHKYSNTIVIVTLGSFKSIVQKLSNIHKKNICYVRHKSYAEVAAHGERHVKQYARVVWHGAHHTQQLQNMQ